MAATAAAAVDRYDRDQDMAAVTGPRFAVAMAAVGQYVPPDTQVRSADAQNMTHILDALRPVVQEYERHHTPVPHPPFNVPPSRPPMHTQPPQLRPARFPGNMTAEGRAYWGNYFDEAPAQAVVPAQAVYVPVVPTQALAPARANPAVWLRPAANPAEWLGHRAPSPDEWQGPANCPVQGLRYLNIPRPHCRDHIYGDRPGCPSCDEIRTWTWYQAIYGRRDP